MFKAVGSPELLRGFQLALEVSGLRHTTIRHYTSDTKKFLAYYSDIPPTEITPTHIREYLAQAQKRLSSKTVYELQLALRKFFRFLAEEGEIDISPCDRIKLTKYRTDPQPLYSLEEIKTLLPSCDSKTLSGIRDYTIITVLFDTGVKVGELISMGLPEWKHHLVSVDGKTGFRYVPLGLNSLRTLERYTRKWNVTHYPLWSGKYGPHSVWSPPDGQEALYGLWSAL